MNSPIGLSFGLSGYLAIAFIHDGGHFSITFTHDGSDTRLRRLRHDEVFDDAVRAIPGLADWIEPARSQAISPALPGGRLYKPYRGQAGLPGLVSVGDAVRTTTPPAGRGVALALMQARELISTLDQNRADISCATLEFDRWCGEHIRPWFDDHRDVDADRMRRRAGGDVDLNRPLPSDLIVAAAEADPALRDIVGPHRLDGRVACKPRARRGPRSGVVRKGLAAIITGRPDPRRAQRGGVQDTGSRLMP